MTGRKSTVREKGGEPVADAEQARRVYAGETMPQRIQRRRTALIDAAIAVVADRGWRQLTVERVCESAGLIRRYFYESFADLDAITEAMIDTVADQLLTRVVRNDLDAPRDELIHTMVGEVVEYGIENPAHVRTLFGEMSSTTAAARRRLAAIGRIVQILAVDDPMIDLAASLLVNGSTATLLDWLDGKIAMSERQFIDDLATLWLLVTEGAIAQLARRSGPR
jgi:AcrR family transcriptional regulator